MKTDMLEEMFSFHPAFPFVAFASTSLRRLGWWWFWGCEVCLSAAGAGRRFHSSPEFSPPECLVEVHHTPTCRSIPYVTEKANQSISPLVVVAVGYIVIFKMYSWRQHFASCFSIVMNDSKRKLKSWFLKSCPQTSKVSQNQPLFQRLLSSYPLPAGNFATWYENSSKFDNLADV